MNTSRNNRSIRKKTYSKYKNSSLSDILKTGNTLAAYKKRIKELLRNNKSLAVNLQDAKYKAAIQEKEKEEYTRTYTQVSHAQLKLKDMACTIQKLVCDLEEVRGCLDVNSFNLLKNFDSSDHRLKIQVPDHSTIEESASMSMLESDLSTPEGSGSLRAAVHANSPMAREDSITEVYDHKTVLARVDSVLKGCLVKSQEEKNAKIQITDNGASISIQSQPKPHLEVSKSKLPGKLEAFLQNCKEPARKPLQALNTIPFVKNTANTFVSKIPKVSKAQPPPQQDENSQPAELPDKASHRRETFVIPKPCSIPEIFITAADRRGTFTISNLSEDSKCRNDRRGTYVVPPETVPPAQEETNPNINNFTDTVFCAENALSNKTILLCEDMELTEIIPTRKPWNEPNEIAKEIPCEKPKENVSPIADEDVEFTDIVPVLEKPQIKAKIIEKGKVVVDKNPSPKENVPSVPAIGSPLEDHCFVKPLAPKSSKTPSPMSSNNSASLELKKIRTSIVADFAEDQIVTSRKSSAKRKKSQDIDLPDLATKETLKGRASSMSKRKSVARKGKVSDDKSKGTSRKSIAKSSHKKPSTIDSDVDSISEIEDDSLSDINLSRSSSPCKRRTRKKSTINYEQFFSDTSFNSIPEPDKKNAPLGRRVIDFFETRQSLLPNKRVFVFTNTSKKGNSESTSTSAHQTDGNAPNIELAKEGADNDVFEFSASDSECGSTKSKPKKSKKRTNRSDSASSTRSRKDSLNKKPRYEKISHQQIEENTNSEVNVPNKKDSCPKNSDSTTLKRHTLKSTSLDLTDDSFVIGDKMPEETKIKELVNSKGDRIFSEFSKPSRKTSSRNCKKLSTENINAKCISPENISNVDSIAYKDVYNPSSSELTSPPVIQDEKKCSSSNKHSPITDSEISGKGSSEGLPFKSSKISEGKRKPKRTFSGVSERRSKKKSTLDPPDYLEDFDNSNVLEEALPKSIQLNNNAFVMDCDATEVYNFKDIIPAKVQENNSKSQEQTSDVNKIEQGKGLVEKPETFQVSKAKAAIVDTGALVPTINNSKKPNTESNKEKVPLVKQNKNEESSKKSIFLKSDTLTSSSIIDKKTLNVGNQEQVIEGNKIKHVETIISEVIKSKKPMKDSAKEKVHVFKHNNTEDNLKKAKLPETETLTSTSVFDKSKKIFAVVNQEQVIEGNTLMKDSNKGKVLLVNQNKNEENSKKAAITNTETLTSSSVIEKSKKTMNVGSQEQVVELNNKPLKDSIKEKVPLVKQYKNEENSKTSSSNIDKIKKTLTVGNLEPVIEKNKVKHVESVISEVAKSTLTKDPLCNTEAIAPILHGGKHKKTTKDLNQEQLTTEKHKVDPTKKFKSKQVVQSTSNNEEAPSNDKISSSAPNKASLFNRVDFKTTHLDDLTNNDFVQPKTKKLYKEPKDKEDRALVKEKRPKSKKTHEEKSNSEELKTKSKETAIVETHIDPKSSKDAQNFEEVFPAKVEDSIPIHRQNCSGSIGSLSNADSRENEGRPSRRNRATKSYKEPKLNCKMRR